MEKIINEMRQLYEYAKGEYRRGPTHVCTTEYTNTFPKKLPPAIGLDKTLVKPDFIADGLPPQYHGKQTHTRVDRNIYRPTR